MKSLSDIQDQKQRHRSSVKTEDGFYVHFLGKNYSFGEVFVEQLNGHHETIEAQFIKLIISGEMPIGPEPGICKESSLKKRERPERPRCDFL